MYPYLAVPYASLLNIGLGSSPYVNNLNRILFGTSCNNSADCVLNLSTIPSLSVSLVIDFTYARNANIFGLILLDSIVELASINIPFIPGGNAGLGLSFLPTIIE